MKKATFQIKDTMGSGGLEQCIMSDLSSFDCIYYFVIGSKQFVTTGHSQAV